MSNHEMKHEQMKVDIKDKFDIVAQQYDEQRKKLIPCFDDYYGVASSLAKTDKLNPRILDIGAGTGLFSSIVIGQYPNASFTLIDLSEKMLDQAKQRFGEHGDVTYIVADYVNYNFTEQYDIIISSLSIHHLTDEEKLKLYRTVYSILNEGGVFINADQVEGHSQYVDRLYREDWSSRVEISGLSKEDITAAYERTALDKMSPLHVQLDWLREIGFTEVDCVYKYFNFVVMYAVK